MHLYAIDWAIVVFTLFICFFPALFFGKLAGKNTSEFFASGRSVPWWLAGLSMVATTFSSDTPNWVTQQVRQYGVAGNWQWWAFVLTGVSTVFFFARLWRRSGVMTDLEFYELRYSGKAASVVRGFRAVYLGLFFNCFIMRWSRWRRARSPTSSSACRSGKRSSSAARSTSYSRRIQDCGASSSSTWCSSSSR